MTWVVPLFAGAGRFGGSSLPERPQPPDGPADFDGSSDRAGIRDPGRGLPICGGSDSWGREEADGGARRAEMRHAGRDPGFRRRTGMARLSIRPSHSHVARYRPCPAGWVCFLLTSVVLAGRAGAQAPTVDTSVPALPGGVGSSL